MCTTIYLPQREAEEQLNTFLVSNGRVQKYVTYLCSLFSSTMVSNL